MKASGPNSWQPVQKREESLAEKHVQLRTELLHSLGNACTLPPQPPSDQERAAPKPRTFFLSDVPDNLPAQCPTADHFLAYNHGFEWSTKKQGITQWERDKHIAEEEAKLPSDVRAALRTVRAKTDVMQREANIQLHPPVRESLAFNQPTGAPPQLVDVDTRAVPPRAPPIDHHAAQRAEDLAKIAALTHLFDAVPEPVPLQRREDATLQKKSKTATLLSDTTHVEEDATGNVTIYRDVKDTVRQALSLASGMITRLSLHDDFISKEEHTALAQQQCSDGLIAAIGGILGDDDLVLAAASAPTSPGSNPSPVEMGADQEHVAMMDRRFHSNLAEISDLAERVRQAARDPFGRRKTRLGLGGDDSDSEPDQDIDFGEDSELRRTSATTSEAHISSSTSTGGGGRKAWKVLQGLIHANAAGHLAANAIVRMQKRVKRNNNAKEAADAAEKARLARLRDDRLATLKNALRENNMSAVDKTQSTLLAHLKKAAADDENRKRVTLVTVAQPEEDLFVDIYRDQIGRSAGLISNLTPQSSVDVTPLAAARRASIGEALRAARGSKDLTGSLTSPPARPKSATGATSPTTTIAAPTVNPASESRRIVLERKPVPKAQGIFLVQEMPDPVDPVVELFVANRSAVTDIIHIQLDFGKCEYVVVQPESTGMLQTDATHFIVSVVPGAKQLVAILTREPGRLSWKREITPTLIPQTAFDAIRKALLNKGKPNSTQLGRAASTVSLQQESSLTTDASSPPSGKAQPSPAPLATPAADRHGLPSPMPAGTASRLSRRSSGDASTVPTTEHADNTADDTAAGPKGGEPNFAILAAMKLALRKHNKRQEFVKSINDTIAQQHAQAASHGAATPSTEEGQWGQGAYDGDTVRRQHRPVSLAGADSPFTTFINPPPGLPAGPPKPPITNKEPKTKERGPSVQDTVAAARLRRTGTTMSGQSATSTNGTPPPVEQILGDASVTVTPSGPTVPTTTVADAPMLPASSGEGQEVDNNAINAAAASTHSTKKRRSSTAFGNNSLSIRSNSRRRSTTTASASTSANPSQRNSLRGKTQSIIATKKIRNRSRGGGSVSFAGPAGGGGELDGDDTLQGRPSLVSVPSNPRFVVTDPDGEHHGLISATSSMHLSGSSRDEPPRVGNIVEADDDSDAPDLFATDSMARGGKKDSIAPTRPPLTLPASQNPFSTSDWGHAASFDLGTDKALVVQRRASIMSPLEADDVSPSNLGLPGKSILKRPSNFATEDEDDEVPVDWGAAHRRPVNVQDVVQRRVVLAPQPPGDDDASAAAAGKRKQSAARRKLSESAASSRWQRVATVQSSVAVFAPRKSVSRDEKDPSSTDNAKAAVPPPPEDPARVAAGGRSPINSEENRSPRSRRSSAGVTENANSSFDSPSATRRASRRTSKAATEASDSQANTPRADDIRRAPPVEGGGAAVTAEPQTEGSEVAAVKSQLGPWPSDNGRPNGVTIIEPDDSPTAPSGNATRPGVDGERGSDFYSRRSSRRDRQRGGEGTDSRNGATEETEADESEATGTSRSDRTPSEGHIAAQPGSSQGSRIANRGRRRSSQPSDAPVDDPAFNALSPAAQRHSRRFTNFLQSRSKRNDANDRNTVAGALENETRKKRVASLVERMKERALREGRAAQERSDAAQSKATSQGQSNPQDASQKDAPVEGVDEGFREDPEHFVMGVQHVFDEAAIELGKSRDDVESRMMLSEHESITDELQQALTRLRQLTATNTQSAQVRESLIVQAWTAQVKRELLLEKMIALIERKVGPHRFMRPFYDDNVYVAESDIASSHGNARSVGRTTFDRTRLVRTIAHVAALRAVPSDGTLPVIVTARPAVQPTAPPAPRPAHLTARERYAKLHRGGRILL